MIDRLLELAEFYPWPEEKPNVPQDFHGWFAGRPKTLKKLLAEKKPKLILELGSWLGRSTTFFLDECPDARLIALDHWKGDPTNWCQPGCKERIPTLYETFLVNMWPYKDRLFPIKENTGTGIDLLNVYGIEPDFVYIDAGHDKRSVKHDLMNCLHSFPDALITGDDWGDFEVSEGVNEVKERPKDFGFRFDVRTEGKVWWIENAKYLFPA